MTKAPQKKSGERDMNGKGGTDKVPRAGSAGARVDEGKAGQKDRDRLTAALRNNYQSTVEEGVPDAFQDLIDKLK